VVNNEPRIGSLFSGYGGLAAQRAAALDLRHNGARHA
jgi:hypothetical protein